MPSQPLPRRRGRPRKPDAGVSHLQRPSLRSWTPAHVTLRVVAGIPNLRDDATFRAVHRALRQGNLRDGFRLVHYAVQRDHLELIVEARTTQALSRAMQGLMIRLAKALNRRLRRHGRVFQDRYSSRPLTDARAARDALRDVLNSARRQAPLASRTRTTWVDPCSSAPFFSGWSIPTGVPRRTPAGKDASLIALGNAAVPPRTRLLAGGWRSAGPISITYVPDPPEPPTREVTRGHE